MWSILNDIINSDNRNWFKQYWSWADQYCNFILSSTIKEDKALLKDADKNGFTYNADDDYNNFIDNHFNLSIFPIFVLRKSEINS